VLGTGCAKCIALSKTLREVLDEMGVEADVEEVKDMGRILEYPILTTPGLVIDGRLALYGRVPKKEEVKRFLQDAQGGGR